jgi:hypothetical protein
VSNPATAKRSEKVSGLYLCQFSQGTIKVGMGGDAVARLAGHKAAGIAFGISVVRTDVIPCDHPKKAERLLIEWCGKHSIRCNGREWFDGVDYEECLAAAKAAAIAMMGPHQERPAKKDFFQAMMDSFGRARTKEDDLYREVREMMVRNHVPSVVVRAFDYLHQESERVRATMHIGGPMPEWYDLLNCFEFWEIELWFDDGRPSAELMRAAADAILAITRSAQVGEGAYA